MTARTLPKNIDIAIIGAGTQALTLVTHILQKKTKFRRRLLVLDPSGSWLTQWRHQFAAQEIPYLRSPAVHHPHPNPHALRKFAEHRQDELFAPYDLPGTHLFNDFCTNLVKNCNLDELIYPDAVTRILPIESSHGRRFQLNLESGQLLQARRVVLATGTGIPQFPDWVSKINTPYPRERLLHSRQIDLRTLKLTRERILIIGGGLSSGHLTVGAIARSAKVVLMSRRELQEKLFDADPGWLGPKYLKGFNHELDWEKRWQMIQTARNGGSMTPAMMLQLRRLTRDGKLKIEEQCEVIQARWQNHQWQIKCQDGKNFFCDRIWLGTGANLSVENYPLLTDILDTHLTPFVHGLPILDEYLRWSSLALFMMGGLAALQIGPVARNLAGAIKGSQRISKALVKPSLAIS
ncbi:MAG: FAD/NAD(P)-binding protein [Cyanobacteria bacterium P01_G01_bin.49]